MPDDAPWVDPIVVPDDLRDLQADVEAYHRERRLAARRRRVQRLTGSRGWRRLALPLAAGACSLGLAGIVFAVLTLGNPRPESRPSPTPVAAHPRAGVGALNGLLPDVAVRNAAHDVSIRALRPALVALVPLHCGCTTLLTNLASQADEVRVPLVVVAPAASDAEIAALPGRVHRGQVTPVYDAGGRLAGIYRASGVTVLVVGPDATVTYRQPDVTADIRLEPPLEQMAAPIAG